MTYLRIAYTLHDLLTYSPKRCMTYLRIAHNCMTYLSIALSLHSPIRQRRCMTYLPVAPYVNSTGVVVRFGAAVDERSVVFKQMVDVVEEDTVEAETLFRFLKANVHYSSLVKNRRMTLNSPIK